MGRLLFLCMFFMGFMFSCSETGQPDAHYKIKALEHAENSKDTAAVSATFLPDALLYTTDLMPVKGRDAIVSIYDFVFSRNDLESVRYQVDSAFTKEGHYEECGMVITNRTGQGVSRQAFHAVFEKEEDRYLILSMAYGDKDEIKKELPRMLAPTGAYGVGMKHCFNERNETANARMLSFQIWYPTPTGEGDKLPFRNEEVIKAMAEFMGSPQFALSYFSQIESYAVLDAPVVEDKNFPLLVYNHGYGGFTQVYQTVFEDLASHGYVVVSIGHEDESALLIKEDGSVRANKPDNPFYTKRAPELNGPEIGQWQHIILNSDQPKQNELAYRKMLELTPLHNESTRLWAEDTRAVIKILKQNSAGANRPEACMDFGRMGIFGHSLGGATAGELSYGDALFKAGINLDGFQFGNLYGTSLGIPFLFVSSNPEGDRFLRASTFIDRSLADAYQVALETFSHDSFTDLKFILEGDEEAMKLQRILIRSFFDRYLKDRMVDLNELENTFDNLEIKYSNVP